MTFLVTKRQQRALLLFGWAVAGPIVLVMLIPVLWSGDMSWPVLGYSLAMLVVGFALIPLTMRRWARNGYVADHLGIRPNFGMARGFVPWHRIVDIRTERRFGRTRVVLYLDSGRVNWMPFPYDGNLLAHDPEFPAKVRALRDMWETHRRVPPDQTTAHV